MTAITYVAAFDPFHAIFRILSLLECGLGTQVEVDKVRIFDFYLCFPHLIDKFEAARDVPGFVKSRNTAKKQYKDNPYLSLPPSRQLFQRMQQHQLAALNTLGTTGLLDRHALLNGMVNRSELKPSTKLVSELKSFVADNSELFEVIGKMSQLPLYGPSGLKKRSQLEEFRYDAV